MVEQISEIAHFGDLFIASVLLCLFAVTLLKVNHQ